VTQVSVDTLPLQSEEYPPAKFGARKSGSTLAYDVQTRRPSDSFFPEGNAVPGVPQVATNKSAVSMQALAMLRAQSGNPQWSDRSL
jgi:hypothetical protein